MNRNIYNSVTISNNEINHLLLLNKRKELIITGGAYFSFSEINNDNLENSLSEISQYVANNKLTKISLVNKDILKYNFILENVESSNLRIEVLNKFKSYFDINLGEYYIDYEISEFNNMKIVFAAGAPKKLIDNYVACFRKFDFKLLSLEVEINSLSRLAGNFFTDKIVMAVNMRKDTTDFLVLKNNILLSFRELPHGYNTILNFISEETGKSIEDIEDIISRKSSFEELPVTNSLDKFTLELQRTIDFYNNQFRENPIEKLILMSDISNINGIDNFLSQLFILEVELFNPLKYFLVDNNVSLDLENMNLLLETLGAGLRK